MRQAFVRTLLDLAAADPRVMLITGDLGYNVLEEYATRFPAQFLNAGVAEQNMTGVAAGLALSGHVVFTYSIANFPTLRCLEQIRNDVCLHRANVTIVAVGGGLAYGVLGPTHHGTEDLAIMAALPEMTVFAPGDPVEAALATRAAAALPGPCYLRLGKAGEPIVHTRPPAFRVGAAIAVREGERATVLTTGATLALAVEAADRLAAAGRPVAVLSFPTFRPLDREAVVEAARRTGRLVTVEEHAGGGLAAAVAEVLAGIGHPVPLRAVRLPASVIDTVGSQSHLRAALGLTVDAVLAAVEGP